jgi:hypothetical protein
MERIFSAGNLYAAGDRLLLDMGRQGLAGSDAGELCQHDEDEPPGFGLYQCRFYRRPGHRLLSRRRGPKAISGRLTDISPFFAGIFLIRTKSGFN